MATSRALIAQLQAAIDAAEADGYTE